MKNSLKIIILALGIGVAPLTAQDVTPKIISIKDSGLNLGNWEHPIQLNPKEIKNYHQMEIEQQDYLRKHYDGYNISGRLFTMENDRFILIYILRNDEKKNDMAYFDMTDIYEKLSKSGDKETRKKIKELRSKHSQKK